VTRGARQADPAAHAAPAPVAAAGTSGLSKIASGSALNLVGAGVSSLAGVALVIVVTRGMPPSAAGQFFTLTSLFLLAEMIACLGTGTGLVYFTARMRSLGQPERIRVFQRVALPPVFLLSMATAAVLIVWAPEFARLAGGGETNRAAVVTLALLLPLAVLSDTLLAGTRGHATMLPTVALERTGRPLLQLALVAVAIGTGSQWLLAGAWALPWVASAAFAGWWLLRLGGRQSSAAAGPPVGGSQGAWREFWAFTWPRSVSSVVQLALQRLDIILIAALIGPAQAAVYTAATRFLVVGQLSSTSIANAAQPRLAELMAVQDRVSTKAVYQSATAWIVLLTWPLYLLVAVFADFVLGVFGSSYRSGATVVLVLAGAMLFATACGMVDMLLNMAGRTSWTLANSIVALGVMLAVDLTLIPRIGIMGAGIGWAAAILVSNGLPLSQLLISFGLHPFGRPTLRAAALAAVCFGVVPGAARLLLPDRPLVAVAAVVLGLAAYLVACLRWRTALGLPALAAFRRRAGRQSRAAEPVAAASEGVA
jgi:O-antigen/teichoic acid export membrane protein